MANHKYLIAVLVAVAALSGVSAPTVAAASGVASNTTSSGVRYHVVSSGDSVESIARAYGVDPDTIRAANGIVGDRLYLGARILLEAPNAGLGSQRISSSTPKQAKQSSAGGSATYTVKEGDALERIARKHGVKLSALLSANGLKKSSTILPGDKLSIPGSTGSGGSSNAGASTSSEYTVKDGDVLERIARKHGVKLSALLSANGLKKSSLILPGDELTIPGGSSSKSSSSTSSSNEASGTSSGSSSTAGSVGPDLVCPVPGASFMNDWGFPRGGTRFHEGTDLFASTGTTIYAPASGVVSFGSNNLGGTTFSLSTDSGWVVYGAHLDDTIGSSGRVAAGTPIATVGSSGNAAGGDPHLHLGLKPAGGSAVNPYPSISAAC